MLAFRLLLLSIIGVVLVYTGLVISAHGWRFLPVFFGDMAAMTWAGQFNLDFSCFLLLSGLWLAWRNHFTPVGLTLGALALIGGAPFVAAYLLITSIRTNGDVKVLLLGKVRASPKSGDPTFSLQSAATPCTRFGATEHGDAPLAAITAHVPQAASVQSP